MSKEKIELIIEQKVKQYVAAQKRYNGDSALSKRLEGEIDALEQQLKEVDNYE